MRLFTARREWALQAASRPSKWFLRGMLDRAWHQCMKMDSYEILQLLVFVRSGQDWPGVSLDHNFVDASVVEGFYYGLCKAGKKHKYAWQAGIFGGYSGGPGRDILNAIRKCITSSRWVFYRGRNRWNNNIRFLSSGLLLGGTAVSSQTRPTMVHAEVLSSMSGSGKY
uniref:Uncharacterized protein n=1 Tax=Odontella aurita TaxID=265563 RepID=A0A7S4I1Z3_9STRA|mmetsp:Transcript_18763/g.54208  ORF Transcript_18763/g.54208 Transcript_18763/m.54208 type:complete len:168 (+) Transcript_18763:284-787(+)